MRVEPGAAHRQDRGDGTRVAVDRDQTSGVAGGQRRGGRGAVERPLAHLLEQPALLGGLGPQPLAGVGHLGAHVVGGRRARGEHVALGLQGVDQPVRGQGHVRVAAELRGVAGLLDGGHHGVAGDGEESRERDDQEEHEAAADAHLPAGRWSVRSA